ncbi:hypothetical protein H2198_010430 [Neophaeococcomyces mojaviensis]|uniref:Uncharacterized protein n=1 Tax=Neophaeococcomyces mojaviensis TaxID=3383035 RepID=A0ACC2ZRQ6_9EURO|nr:hypothetical protein H2198_010430 [Knufia sp. JES_112]
MVGLRTRLKGLKHGKSASRSETPSEPDRHDGRRHTADLASLSSKQSSYRAPPPGAKAIPTGPSESELTASGNTSAPATFNGITSAHMGNVYYHCNQDILQHKTEVEVSKAFRGALYYSTMDDRKAQLQSIDAASFDWIWTQTAFPQWLQGPDGLFWICGKPASGKSTLAHHLATTRDGSEEVLKWLQQGDQKWTLIHFFFDFRAGKGIANTPAGMLRSLLLQLTDQVKSANEFVVERLGHRLDGNWPEHESELLALLSDAARAAEVRVCGFIDGLDEYKGKLADLASTIFTLQQHSGMKLCLASRPENELAYQLQNIPGFTMQDHNHATIYAYIHAAISSLAQFATFENLDPIVHKIAYHANGVILWARFAVDELVSGVLRGSSLTEINQQLDFFPPELEAVYARMWDVLTPWEKIQAAVALCVVENWSLSQSSATEPLTKSLMIEDLVAIWCMTIEQMDENRSFGQEFTEMQFRLRIHTMIGGLIEFVGVNASFRAHDVVVRLVHRSFQSYLDRSQEYQTIADNLRQYIDVGVLAPKFYAQIIKAASQDLIINPNVELTDNSRDHRHLAKALESFKCRDVYPCRVHNPKSLARALLYLLYFKVLDEPEHLPLLRSTTKSWLWQMCGDANHRAMLWALPERPHQYLELFSFTSHGMANGFEDALKEYDAEISDWYRTLLFSFAISLLVDGSLTVPTARFILATLPAMPWQAHYLALTAISADEPIFTTIASAITAKAFDYDTMIRPSVWWQHEAMHILCCWVWSPFHIDCGKTQRQRLDFLLARGVSVNDRIYPGGTVLHALFESTPFNSQNTYLRHYGLPESRRRQSRFSNDMAHFSIVKLQVLLQTNVDLSANGPNATVTDAARALVQRLGNDNSVTNWGGHTADEVTRDMQTMKTIHNEAIPILEARMAEDNDKEMEHSAP